MTLKFLNCRSQQLRVMFQNKHCPSSVNKQFILASAEVCLGWIQNDTCHCCSLPDQLDLLIQLSDC